MDFRTYPGAETSCEAEDRDCDGLLDNADNDGDGFVDLVVSHADERNDAHVFYNDGLGQFGVQRLRDMFGVRLRPFFYVLP